MSFLALPLLAIVGGCGGADPQPNVAEPPPAPVRLMLVGARGPGDVRVAAGTVRLRRETPLAFVEAGRIDTLAVREGDRVAAGQLLASLDRSAIDATVAAAAADQARARADLQRQRTLMKQGWVTKARLETAEAVAQAADAQMTGARFQQQFSTIRAPSAGVILQRLAEPGQTLGAGTPVLLLGEFSSGHVLRVGVGAGDIADLQPGQPADIRFRDGAAPATRGTVIEVSGRADPATGTFRVEFALPAGAAFRSGMIAEARWAARTRGAGTLTVPASALFAARADEAFVWRLDPPSGRIGARLVKIGATRDRGVDVLSGLAPGDRVVAAGVDRLVEGQRVKPVAGGA